MVRSERYERGIEVLKAIGSAPDSYDRRFGPLHPTIGPEIATLITEFCWGDVWARPELDLKTKRLLTIAMLIAQGRERQLRVHLAGALDQGISREEVLAVCIHAIPYCGLPAAVTALEIAREVFEAAEKRSP